MGTWYLVLVAVLGFIGFTGGIRSVAVWDILCQPYKCLHDNQKNVCQLEHNALGVSNDKTVISLLKYYNAGLAQHSMDLN